jgi:hypothetical protein
LLAYEFNKPIPFFHCTPPGLFDRWLFLYQ